MENGATNKVNKTVVIIVGVIAAILCIGAIAMMILIKTHIICVEHEFKAATCTEPQTCVYCGKQTGEALGHKWEEATCTKQKTCKVCGEATGDKAEHDYEMATCLAPKTCKVCGKTEGDLADHTWVAATCTEPKTCKVCGETEGEALGHDFAEATCTEPETCKVCKKKQGEPLGHTLNSFETTKEATCTEEGERRGVCAVCEQEVVEEIEMKEHTESDWIIEVEPTSYSKGTRVKKCTVCDKQLESEKFELSEEELKELYKKSCESISYDTLSRYPDDNKGKKIKFTGRVVQVCYESDSLLYYSTYRVATSGKYDNVVYLKVSTYGKDARILEGDKITFYGTYDGLYSYETVMGAQLTIPEITAEYIN